MIFLGAPLLIVVVASSSKPLPTLRSEATPTTMPVLSGVAEPSNWQYQTGESADRHFYVEASVLSSRYSSSDPNAKGPATLGIVCFPDTQQTVIFIDFGNDISNGSELVSVEYTFDDQITVERTWLSGSDHASIIAPEAIEDSFASWAMESHRLQVEARSWAGSESSLLFHLSGKSNPWHPVLLVLEACGDA